MSQAWVVPEVFPVLFFVEKQGKAKLPSPCDIFRDIKSKGSCQLFESVKPMDFNKKGNRVQGQV